MLSAKKRSLINSPRVKLSWMSSRLSVARDQFELYWRAVYGPFGCELDNGIHDSAKKTLHCSSVFDLFIGVECTV